MKPAYHYCNIIKIKNKGYNQMKDPTIIRRTMEVRRRDHVRNVIILIILLNIMIQLLITIIYLTLKDTIISLFDHSYTLI